MKNREDQDIRNNNVQARVFVVKGDLILVMFRRKNGEEYHVFPGGHMRQGETPLETAVRELVEETSVKCKNVKRAYEVTDYASAEQKKEYYFVGEWESGDPKLSGEESRRSCEDNYYEPRWIPLSAVPSLTIYPASAKEWVELNVIR